MSNGATRYPRGARLKVDKSSSIATAGVPSSLEALRLS